MSEFKELVVCAFVDNLFSASNVFSFWFKHDLFSTGVEPTVDCSTDLVLRCLRLFSSLSCDDLGDEIVLL